MPRTGPLLSAGQPLRLHRSAGHGAASSNRHVEPAAIAQRLGAVVRWPGAASVRDRSWRLIAQTREFDAWLIAWPRESAAELHDHGGSRGALHVIRGALVETTPARDGEGGVTLARREVNAGVTLGFGAGHVHDVRNVATEYALSLHVYSPPLTSMNYYDRFGDRLLPREKEWASTRSQSEFPFAAP